MPDLSVRPMTRPELDTVVEWAAAEGWNPGLYDADAFYAADPAGYYLGVLDGAPAASISVVRYGAEYGFVGFYIVPPELRRRGYGLATWEHALGLTKTRNLGLDGVLAQQANYERQGFVAAYRTSRFEAVAAPDDGASQGLTPLRDVPFDALLAYDSAVYPAPRPAFLRAWVGLPESAGYAAVTDGRLSGYGLLRRCRVGYKVGPLFADGASTAERLLDALLASAEPGAPVYIDVPQVNREALRLAEARSMTPVGETVRMYTNGAPSTPVEKVFGVTSLELG